jgi:hypothetical protein
MNMDIKIDTDINGVSLGHFATAPILEPKYIEVHPYVGEDGIYTPVNQYVREGCESVYKLIMTKEMFVEAYNKWIKEEVT